jgi:SAM-dependent methyltransferase|tara:strand:+ start:765 stop:1562 length:798 start_codon:yes stop_codon:yes gene_type:complete
MSNEIQTWHYGLVARWWAEFNEGGSDVAFFQKIIERCGEPVLDAGCGTGRLLLPFLRSGLDVDGSDVSPDMIAWCAAKAEADELPVNLYTQAMHELDLPRRYCTVVLCGAFGLGGDRSTDLEGLRRIHSQLESGGTLVMDHHLGKHNVDSDTAWQIPENLELPGSWPDKGDRRCMSGGGELELRTRLVGVDAAARSIVREISVLQFDSGVEVANDAYSIVICSYSAMEVENMLIEAGFGEVRVTGTLEVEDPALDAERIVFEATA